MTSTAHIMDISSTYPNWRKFYAVFVDDRQVADIAQHMDGRWRAFISFRFLGRYNDETFRTEEAARLYLFEALGVEDPGELYTPDLSIPPEEETV